MNGVATWRCVLFAVDVGVVDLGIRSQRKLGMTVASLGEKLVLSHIGMGAGLTLCRRNGCSTRV